MRLRCEDLIHEVKEVLSDQVGVDDFNLQKAVATPRGLEEGTQTVGNPHEGTNSQGNIIVLKGLI